MALNGNEDHGLVGRAPAALAGPWATHERLVRLDLAAQSSRPGSTMTVLNRCSIAHAVW